ncbi:MAG: hypothetical protein ACREBI_04495 [Nitrosotalea sp.]
MTEQIKTSRPIYNISKYQYWMDPMINIENYYGTINHGWNAYGIILGAQT